MVVGKQLHELLELVLSLLAGWRQQLLNDLEYRYDVPLLRLTELGYQQNRRRQQPLGRIIKIGVLPEGSGVHAGEDDGLRDDLGVFFASGLIYQLVRVRLVQVHIFIDQMQEVIAVAPGRVPKVDYRNMISIVLGDLAVVAHDIAFGVG